MALDWSKTKYRADMKTLKQKSTNIVDENDSLKNDWLTKLMNKEAKTTKKKKSKKNTKRP